MTPFVQNVMKSLPEICTQEVITDLKNVGWNDEEVKRICAETLESVQKSIAELEKEGWTENEARRYAMCWEEVDPKLEEEKALARMQKIRQEVNNRLNNVQRVVQ